MKPTLLILAAGMGSRYGGLKQIDPIGPNGELIVDYSIYDAIKAGFGKIVFVIRRESEGLFKEKIGIKYEKMIDIEYAHQELDICIGDFEVPADRKKPWGTGHAILAAKDVIDGPLAVINADDFYGQQAFKLIAGYLSESDISPNQYCMAGYDLENTLSEHGSVCRGICVLDENGFLETVTEHTDIKKDRDRINALDGQGRQCHIDETSVVSMNLWGFMPSIFGHLQKQFDDFLKEKGQEKKSELFIPTVVDALVNNGTATVKVLKTNDRWFGITYKQDKEIVRSRIKSLIEKGLYPPKLWKD